MIVGTVLIRCFHCETDIGTIKYELQKPGQVLIFCEPCWKAMPRTYHEALHGLIDLIDPEPFNPNVDGSTC